MRIVFDLDGVICEIKKEGQTYSDVKPLPNAIARLKALKNAGHYIIIQSARHMKTCEANSGLVMRKIGKITLDWLDQYGVPYDEIHFGKPNADLYIDDRAVRFTVWEELTDSFLTDSAKEK
jgi:capsule biosynthesis phosphatase